jgi:hypothetical protein
MRAVKSALSVACLLLMTGTVGTVQAQPGGGGDKFSLKVCNEFASPVKIALAVHLVPRQPRFGAVGWLPLGPNECGALDLPRNVFGIFAFAGTPQKIEKIWAGDVKICVNLTKDFAAPIVPNSRCKPGEVVAPFAAFEVPDDAQEYELTIPAD